MRGGRAEEPADVVVAHIEHRLEETELVAAVVGGPEGDDGFERRTSRHAACDFGDEDGGGVLELEPATRPRLDCNDGVELRADRAERSAWLGFEGQRIGDDCPMVEGELLLLPVQDKARIRGVVSGANLV